MRTKNDDPLSKRVYYSQNREDIILEAFFPDVDEGFYVDVGASDPVKYSVTKLFYDKGWSGINVEPIKHHHGSLMEQRPEDINLNIGVGSKAATLKFFEYVGGDGLSTFSSDVAEECSHQEDFPFKDGKEYMVAVKTLNTVFKEHNVKHIHFIKIDVEGFEYDVLAGNDWSKYRPEVICIESNHITKDWRPLLAQNEYQLAFADGLNEYYADARTDRAAKFDFVNHVVIGYDGGLKYSDYEMILQQRDAIREAHLRLQASLEAHAKQTRLYNELLAGNHANHTRAVVAERALRHPSAYTKYQLKTLHRVLTRKLATKPAPEYLDDERRRMQQSLEKLGGAKGSRDLLVALQEVAEVETTRLERMYRASQKNPAILTSYKKVVSGVKRLKLKGIIK